MKKAFVVAVDDDLSVLKAVERDLKAKYSAQYRVMTADAPGKALELVKQLTVRGDRVALFLADQRMPLMTGTEFLQEAMKLQPAARRVLLTAYADSSAAIGAINTIKLNHYLMKPWAPPEQHLYPVLTDLLEEWTAANPAEFEGIQVVGPRWLPETHRMKDFLAKSQVPYRWREPEAEAGAMPMVVFPDGTVMERPETGAVAAKLGLAMTPSRRFYDVVVVGAGPAGLACALYCSTEGLKTAMVEKEAAGGQAGLSSRIENYLGFPSGLSGADLARRGVTQVKRFGTEVIAPAEAVNLKIEGDYRVVTLSNGQELAAHAVVIAAGVQWRRLDVPGLDRLTGAGVYYGAATTEAASCAGEDVYIVGGANSAGQAAVHFSEIARSVTMIIRGEALSKSMSHYLHERIATIPNIHVIANAEVVGVSGEERLESITIRQDGAEDRTVPAVALFVFIGAEPHTEWLEGVVKRDDKGFIVTGVNLPRTGKRDPYLLETSVEGVFAVGDVRDAAIRRVANSVGEGSIVLYFIRQYMRNR